MTTILLSVPENEENAGDDTEDNIADFEVEDLFGASLYDGAGADVERAQQQQQQQRVEDISGTSRGSGAATSRDIPSTSRGFSAATSLDMPSTSQDIPSTSRGHLHNMMGGGGERWVPVTDKEDLSVRARTHTPNQQDIGNVSEESQNFYHVSKVSHRRVKKYNANLTDYTVSFNSVNQFGPMIEMIPRVRDMFGNIVDELLVGVRERDMVRIVFNAPQLERPVQLPFVRRDQLDHDMLAARIEAVLQSNEEISLDENVALNVLHMEMPEGGGRAKRYLETAQRLIKKRCIIQIIDRSNEKICCARAIVTGIARIERDPNWNSIRMSYGKQEVYAHKLHAAAGVPIGPCGIEEIKQFESTPQMHNYRVVVVSKEHLNHIIYAGPEDREHTIFLYSHDEHYDLITKMNAFMNKAYFCTICMVGYNRKLSHKCEFTCSLCKSHECPSNARAPNYSKRNDVIILNKRERYTAHGSL
ncbi:uncharacterized protein [Diadema antillarum]|uniref:uncharacterized protein n=1 Tax=Diadema antillarum TaxID=105358 RepID=UPI003A8819EC